MVRKATLSVSLRKEPRRYTRTMVLNQEKIFKYIPTQALGVCARDMYLKKHQTMVAYL